PPVLLDDPLQADQPQIQQATYDGDAAGSLEDIQERGTQFVRRSIDDGTAHIMTSLLQDVVDRGTATILKKIVKRPDIAGKTGTTNDNVDAWFMGFSPDFTCGVWVGFDDEFSLGEGETGGKAAAPIWGYLMKRVLKDIPVKEFPQSQQVEKRRIDPRTGLATSSDYGVEEIFKIGSAPQAPEPELVKGSGQYYGNEADQF
ncbi:penicillin-binding transpeptidase domain-containing protein, partial [Thermodesulfobacteriota bacterium]